MLSNRNRCIELFTLGVVTVAVVLLLPFAVPLIVLGWIVEKIDTWLHKNKGARYDRSV